MAGLSTLMFAALWLLPVGVVVLTNEFRSAGAGRGDGVGLRGSVAQPAEERITPANLALPCASAGAAEALRRAAGADRGGEVVGGDLARRRGRDLRRRLA